MSGNGLSSDNRNLISKIALACIRESIFSEELLKSMVFLCPKWIKKIYQNTSPGERLRI